MPKSYTVTVTTEDGKLLIRYRIVLGFCCLLFPFLHLSRALWLAGGDIKKLRMLLGRGTTPYVSLSQSPTES